MAVKINRRKWKKIPEVLWLKSMTNAEQTQGRCDHNERPCMGIQREQPRPRRCKGCVYLCFGWVTHCVRMRETIWPWHNRPLHLTTSIWDVSAMSTTGSVGKRQIRGAWLHHFRRRPGPGCTLQTIEFYFTKHRLGFRAVPPARCLSLQAGNDYWLFPCACAVSILLLPVLSSAEESEKVFWLRVFWIAFL